jgi:hypothetical protein
MGAYHLLSSNIHEVLDGTPAYVFKAKFDDSIGNGPSGPKKLMEIGTIRGEHLYYLQLVEVLQSMIAERGLIRRKSGKYSLTSFGRVIHDYKLKIENAVAEYYSLKAVDSFNDSREINSVQKKKLIETTVRDNTIKALLTD